MQANPVIHVSVRCADGDGRLSSTKTYQRPRLVAHSLTAGHPTEMHYATRAGSLSTGKMSQAKESFFNRGGRRGTQRTKAEGRRMGANKNFAGCHAHTAGVWREYWGEGFTPG